MRYITPLFHIVRVRVSLFGFQLLALNCRTNQVSRTSAPQEARQQKYKQEEPFPSYSLPNSLTLRDCYNQSFSSPNKQQTSKAVKT